MLHPPPEVIASWPEPNFVNPQMLSNGRAVAAFVMTPMTTLIVLARVYTRLHLTKSFGWDDVILIVATVGTLYSMLLGDKCGNTYSILDLDCRLQHHSRIC